MSTTQKRAVITGITGQDGSYLAELLLQKGYEVVGVTLGGSSRANLVAVESSITFVEGDITDKQFVSGLVSKYKPDEIYNFASVATVAKPWDDVEGTIAVTAMAPLYFLEAIRISSPTTKFFQASSAEMFGTPQTSPQNESTPLKPRNPYGAGKLFAHTMVGMYRSSHNLFAVSGILFNHESPRRPESFVTRKITSSLAKIKLGLMENFSIGNLDAKRDWGFAGDYVEAMYKTLQAEEASDYVVASGKAHSIREFVEAACKELDMPIVWKGSGLDEVGVSNGKIIITINKDFYRPTEPQTLEGDTTRIEAALGWCPQVGFEELVAMMVRADTRALGR
ncbi:MAG TPA: GDP-mannose 4,6-dehydratase [Candidatus Paceibacterota bacterium]|nr:GDP-mannose 4,6-dehydratase [Candidatus Paceibacterota bacterium]